MIGVFKWGDLLLVEIMIVLTCADPEYFEVSLDEKRDGSDLDERTLGRWTNQQEDPSFRRQDTERSAPNVGLSSVREAREQRQEVAGNDGARKSKKKQPANKKNKRRKTSRRWHGTEAPVNLIPSIVQLQMDTWVESRKNCVGHLVSVQHVVTVASCVCRYSDLARKVVGVLEPNKVISRVGSSFLNTGGQVIRTKRIFVHPRHLLVPFTFYFMDVAVLLLKREVMLTPNVLPIELTNQAHLQSIGNVGILCTIGGWGSIMSKFDSHSGFFRYFHVKYFKTSQCVSMYKHHVSSEVNLCIDKRSCFGDFGAGMICDNRLIALVSWGWSCEKKFPLVLARLDVAVPFVKWVLRSSSPRTSHFRLFHISLGCLLLMNHR